MYLFLEGRIDHKEMIDIITILYDLNGGSTNTAKQCAEELFRKLDKNGDGEINEEIFVEGCSKEPSIIFAITNQSLWRFYNPLDFIYIVLCLI